MKVWVLLILVIGSTEVDGYYATTHKFQTEDACHKAKDWFLGQVKHGVKAFCVEDQEGFIVEDEEPEKMFGS